MKHIILFLYLFILISCESKTYIDSDSIITRIRFTGYAGDIRYCRFHISNSKDYMANSTNFLAPCNCFTMEDTIIIVSKSQWQYKDQIKSTDDVDSFSIELFKLSE